MECAMNFAYFDENHSGLSETNIIELNLNCLKQGSQIATGEAIFCSLCKSILNSYSKLTKSLDTHEWVCEFCGTSNLLTLDPDEIPCESELTYVLESASQASSSSSLAKRGGLIFCIDISGSMCVSKPVEGKLNLKTCRMEELRKMIIPGQDDPNFSEENVTYVSRLECVQAAIEHQLQVLSNSSPDLKVGLIAFSGEVRVIGDGVNEEVIAGDRLENYEGLKEWAEQRKHLFFQKTVSQNLQVLKEKVLELQENGLTALGPALLVSVILASETGPGSKVIICTDGLANVGVGALDGMVTSFYVMVGNLACQLGVSVSIISIEGEECQLESLISVTESTGGDVIRVAPEKISEEFANILSCEVIATQVDVQVTLHKAIEFRNEYPQNLSFARSRLEKVVGNATIDSSFSFAFNLKPRDQLERLGIDINELKAIPIQAVISYTSLEGMRCVRVINKIQPITQNKYQAQGSSKIEMMARAGKRQAARFAEQGQYNEVRQLLNEWKTELRGTVLDYEQEANLIQFNEEAEVFEREVLNEELNHKRFEEEEKLSSPEIRETISRNKTELEKPPSSLQVRTRNQSDRYVSAVQRFSKNK